MNLIKITELLLASSKRSKCCSRKVCAGYFNNGVFKTYLNKNINPGNSNCEHIIYKCLECGNEHHGQHICCDEVMLPVDKTFNTVIHAEEELISKNHIDDIDKSTIYITDFPCIRCSRLLISFGIKQIYYIRDFNDNEGMKLLIDNSVNLTKLDVSKIREEFKKLI